MGTFSFSFLWPPSFGSTFTFLLLLFKRWTQIIGAVSSPDIIFNSILFLLILTSLSKRKRMINLGSWE
jgi:hypothetical protein